MEPADTGTLFVDGFVLFPVPRIDKTRPRHSSIIFLVQVAQERRGRTSIGLMMRISGYLLPLQGSTKAVLAH